MGPVVITGAVGATPSKVKAKKPEALAVVKPTSIAFRPITLAEVKAAEVLALIRPVPTNAVNVLGVAIRCCESANCTSAYFCVRSVALIVCVPEIRPSTVIITTSPTAAVVTPVREILNSGLANLVMRSVLDAPVSEPLAKLTSMTF